MIEQENKDDRRLYTFIRVISGYAALIILVISIFALSKFTDSRSSTNALSQQQVTREDKADELDAFYMSQVFVKRMLVSPSSAKFPWFDESMVMQVGEDTWVINSYVDSQNKFGAMLRTNYIVKIKYLGNKRWELLDWVLQER